MIYKIAHENFLNDKEYPVLDVGNCPFGIHDYNYKDNIHELNPYINECTGLYWIWKNCTDDIVGICHYRRWLVKENNIPVQVEDLGDADIIMENKATLHQDLFTHLKGHLFNENEFLKVFDIIKSNIPKEYKESFDYVMSHNDIYLHNIMITRKKIFDKYCKWLFPIIIPAAKYCRDNNVQNKRMVGYIAERMSTVWLHYNNQYKIKEFKVAGPEDKIKIYCNYPCDDWQTPCIEFTREMNNEIVSSLDYRIPRMDTDFSIYKGKLHNVFLVEPEELHKFVDAPGGYNFVRKHYDLFDNIFTWDTEMLKLPNAKFLPWGGVWVSADVPKKKNISIVASHKTYSDLHKQRYDLAWYMKENKIGDTFGTFDGGARIDPEVPLDEYRFSIAIENYKYDYWFTEKICNCFATKTVPIYIGANKIDEFFNKDGIIQVNNIEEIKDLLKNFNYKKEYEKRKEAIEDNYNRVNEFKSPFMYLYKHYYKEIGGK